MIFVPEEERRIVELKGPYTHTKNKNLFTTGNYATDIVCQLVISLLKSFTMQPVLVTERLHVPREKYIFE